MAERHLAWVGRSSTKMAGLVSGGSSTTSAHRSATAPALGVPHARPTAATALIHALGYPTTRAIAPPPAPRPHGPSGHQDKSSDPRQQRPANVIRSYPPGDAGRPTPTPRASSSQPTGRSALKAVIDGHGDSARGRLLCRSHIVDSVPTRRAPISKGKRQIDEGNRNDKLTR